MAGLERVIASVSSVSESLVQRHYLALTHMCDCVWRVSVDYSNDRVYFQMYTLHNEKRRTCVYFLILTSHTQTSNVPTTQVLRDEIGQLKKRLQTSDAVATKLQHELKEVCTHCSYCRHAIVRGTWEHRNLWRYGWLTLPQRYLD